MRETSWTNIGTNVTGLKTLNDVLINSNLDYNVRKCNLYTTLGASITSDNSIAFDNRVATVNENTGEILGIVSNNYEVCQNRDAFDFINYIDDEIEFVKAGQTQGGLVYIIAKLPEVDVLGDKFSPHVIFQNGHNGGISIKAAICPIRIVCQNQFNMSFKDTNNTVSIKHTSSMQDKMIDARSVLRGTAEYMKKLSKEAEKYVGIKVSDSKATEIIDKLFPIKDDMSSRAKASIERNKQRFITAYNSEDNLNFKGTLWQLVNASTDYITHNQPSRLSDNWFENRFMYVTFSPVISNMISTISSMV